VRVSEKPPDHVREMLKRSHVSEDDPSKLFAIPNRSLANSMVLEVVPDVFVGVRVGRVRR